MIAYLNRLGLKYIDGNDPVDKQFFLQSETNEEDLELSTFKNIVTLQTQTFVLFLSFKSFRQIALGGGLSPSDTLYPSDELSPADLETLSLGHSIATILEAARTDGLIVNLDSTEAEKVENGYNITITFLIRDK